MCSNKLIGLAMALSGLINIFMSAAAIDPNCDYYQEMEIGRSYYVYNKEYPNYYSPSTSCRWVAQAPANTRVVLSCEDIQIPASSQCSGDYLGISLSGDPNLNDARKFCGTGTTSLVSDANRLAIGLFSTWYSGGGKFLCTVTAVVTDQPTTTTPAPPDNCDCGWRQERRIVGGQETGINEYPAMAALIQVDSRSLYCGASIIASNYALTAAHCIEGRAVSNIGLLVGDHDISTGAETDAAMLYKISAFIPHEEYNSDTYANDIAIVRTERTIEFSRNVGPICLPFRYSTRDFTGDNVIVLGWGITEFSGPQSDTLQEAVLSVISNNQCAQDFPAGSVRSSEVCTYAPGKDACQSDSGGPLYYYDGSTRRLMQVGIVSHGVGCATDIPGINTRITSYLLWIVSVTGDTRYCIK